MQMDQGCKETICSMFSKINQPDKIFCPKSIKIFSRIIQLREDLSDTCTLARFLICGEVHVGHNTLNTLEVRVVIIYRLVNIDTWSPLRVVILHLRKWGFPVFLFSTIKHPPHLCLLNGIESVLLFLHISCRCWLPSLLLPAEVDNDNDWDNFFSPLTSATRPLCSSGPSQRRSLNWQLQGSQQPGNIDREITKMPSESVTMQCFTICVLGSDITI